MNTDFLTIKRLCKIYEECGATKLEERQGDRCKITWKLPTGVMVGEIKKLVGCDNPTEIIFLKPQDLKFKEIECMLLNLVKSETNETEVTFRVVVYSNSYLLELRVLSGSCTLTNSRKIVEMCGGRLYALEREKIALYVSLIYKWMDRLP